MTLADVLRLVVLTVAAGSALYLLVLLPVLIDALRGSELDRSRRRHRRRWHPGPVRRWLRRVLG